MTMLLDASSLIIIPCCAAKLSGGEMSPNMDPLAAAIPDAVSTQLAAARRTALEQLHGDATLMSGLFAKNRSLQNGPDVGGHVSNGRYMPALERYTGTLYSVTGLRSTLYKRIQDPQAPRVMILSALYGPLDPLSPIQDYNLRMDQAPARVWRRAFLPVLEYYVRARGIRSIILLVGSATAYYRVASAAASALLSRGLIDQASHYHVHDGSTRVTPLEHGKLLLDLLQGRQPTSSRIRHRYLGSSGPAIRQPKSIQISPLPFSLNFVHQPGPAPQQARMQRAPRPNASHAEIIRIAALNAKATPARDSVAVDTSTATSTSTSTSKPEPAPLLPTPIEAVWQRSPTERPVIAPPAGDPVSHLARFFELMHQLTCGADQRLPLAQLLEQARLPERGVYFFLDPSAHDEHTGSRICRIGTHAVSTGSKSTLRARLRTHLGSRNGNGNHRGSIFRLHVGNALLRRDQREIATWGIGSVAPTPLRESEALRHAEAEHEHRVSGYIGQLPVLWLAVPDEASPESERSVIERNSIALLARAQRATPEPLEWLGA